jgi:glycosyltransferase involved in cell wall biosynthesis
MKSIVVVIPAYNEASVLPGVLGKLQDAAKDSQANVITIVVNDGSHDNTEAIARGLGAIVVSHAINRGLGAALSTGITAAHRILSELGLTEESAIVTFDADGQHEPAELFRVVEPLFAGTADVVLGSRFVGLKQESMPVHRTLANRFANAVTGLLFGVWVTDTQSGYRAFSYKAATELMLRTSTMEVSSEIVREIGRNKWRLVEVPITVAYTEYSLSKGQSFGKGLETLWKLIMLRFFR